VINIPESEAFAILSEPKFCHDCTWVPIKTQPYAMEASVGLVDEDGKNMRLLVRLIYLMNPTVGLTKYLFTLFSQKITGLERVYQLEVKQYKKIVKSSHQLPHEHIGDNRVIGSDTWSSWGYDDVLARFESKTNIVFVPKVSHPNYFELQ
jgi:hypothetical protein